MAFGRNKEVKNPTRREMSVADMRNPISKENKKALELLNKQENKKNNK